MVNVSWGEENNTKYIASILVTINKYDKAMIEIMQKANVSNIAIDSIKTLSRTDTVIYEIDLRVNSLERLNNYMRDLNSLKYVINVERIMR